MSYLEINCYPHPASLQCTYRYLVWNTLHNILVKVLIILTATFVVPADANITNLHQQINRTEKSLDKTAPAQNWITHCRQPRGVSLADT